MFPTPPSAISNSTTSLSEEANSVSSDFGALTPLFLSSTNFHHQQQNPPTAKPKKKRSLPGNPDPDAEVIALSPKTLLATNRFVCEICNKGFQRDQNLQLHRRGHNLPWKLKQRNSKEQLRKKAYVCPEPSCVHHHPSRALGDLTGIKKHFCRKHGEKKWKCDKCSKSYAVQSDWKAHYKTCGTREYRCDCGTLFSRKDSFITHRAFCDALAEESARLSANQLPAVAATAFTTTTTNPNNTPQISLFPFPTQHQHHHFKNPQPPLPTPFTTISLTPWNVPPHPNPNPNPSHSSSSSPLHVIKPQPPHLFPTTLSSPPLAPQPHKGFLHVSKQPNASNPAMSSAHLSATALLQKAATVGAAAASAAGGQLAGLTLAEFGTPSHMVSTDYLSSLTSGDLATWHKTDHHLTRDFLGLNGDDDGTGNHVKGMLTYAGGVEFHHHHHQPYDRLRGHNNSLLKDQGFGGFAETAAETWGDC